MAMAQRTGFAMVSIEFERQLRGHGLTTAEILYRMPDHLHLLQSYLWQEYDTAPDFPVLRGFLDFWERELEGPLHTVKVAHLKLVKPSEWRPVDGLFRLH